MRNPSAGSSNRLLRTLAAVPVSSSILDLGCGAGEHTEAFLRLGFPVHACDPRREAVQSARDRVRSLVDGETAMRCVQRASLNDLGDLDATFEWVIGSQPEAYIDSETGLDVLFGAVEPVLSPGGWLYLTLPAVTDERSPASENGPAEDHARTGWSVEQLATDRLETALVESRPPERVDERNSTRIHAVYRRTEVQTLA